MNEVSWIQPPGGAQPDGIMSTAGAIPIVNEKGEVSMKKVKVQRYISGKRPEFAPISSDEEYSDNDDFTKPKAVAPSPPPISRSETELQDPRLRRLLTMQSAPEETIRHEREVVEMRRSDDEDEIESATHRELGKITKLAESDTESEEEVDEDELAIRRMKIRERAMQITETEVLGKEDEGSDESSDENSSEYTEESEEEEEGPRLKPVFVRKKDRVTIQQKEAQYNKQRQLDYDNKKRGDERRRETLRMIEAEHRKAQLERNQNCEDTFAKIEDINTDDEADDAEYEAWKLRELRRIKRDKDEREAIEKDKDEIDRLRNMTEDERRLELRSNPKVITNKALKGKYKFLQKYYHRGAFFLDEEDTVYKRDFSGATLEDHFDKTILPKVMQVKNFGRSGRTKYTHLVDQDTTSFDSPWANDSHVNHKFSNAYAGGMKQVFDKPNLKKPSTSSSSSYKS